jgi:hypothetical protein
MNALMLVLLACPSPLQSYETLPSPGSPRIDHRRPLVTWVTGAMPGADVIFRVRFHHRIPGSARIDLALVEPRHSPLRGIDFKPGTTEVAVGMPMGTISHYDVASGALLPDYIADTDMVAPPPAGPGTHPSTVLTTPFHFYYVENQFGFGTTASHRIMRKTWGPGPIDMIYDGGPHALAKFEGLEFEPVHSRIYFFAKDPALPTKRALVSIGLVPGGLWNGIAPTVHLGGLTADPAGGDGSDGLDRDPWSGVIFGTNIVNGEMIAWDPIAGAEVSSPGSTHFIDGADIAASTGALGALGGDINGVRSAAKGWLIVTGKAGVIATIHIDGVLADGADDGDVRVLAFVPSVSFDDLTPVRKL